MNEGPPPSGTSPLALISVVMGGVGLMFSLLGCITPIFGMMGAMLCLVAIGCGLFEYQNIKAGSSSQANQGLAMAGAGMGGAGCAFGCLYTLVVGGLVFLYIAFVVFIMVFSVIAGN